MGFLIEGFESADRLSTPFMVAGARYFETMGTRIVAGRDFAAADDGGAEPVLIVNESAAARLSTLTGREALGMGLSFEGPDGPFRRVVGISADAKTSSVRADPVAMVYTPQAQTPGWSRMNLVVRSSAAEPGSVLGAVRSAFRETDPNVPAIGVVTLAEYLDSTLGNERLSAALLGFSAILAVVLAGVGLYGVLSYSVGQRRGELGIRMALGAQTGDVRRMVVRHGMVLALLGAVLGLAGAAASGSLLSGFLFGVSGFDATTYVGVIAILAVVAWAASYIPARRATRVDPLTALRTD
jgi:putative ABC transport system permease protein